MSTTNKWEIDMITWDIELLSGSNTQCQEMMRLSRVAYIQLCNHFKQKCWLKDSRHATVEEKIAIFLHVISHNDRFTKVKNRFQHSTETVHRYFHEVLNGMMEFAKEVIVPISYDRNNHLSRKHKELLKIFPVSNRYRILYTSLIYLS